ncbi:MAG: hypothetical protein AAFX87_15060 [Bacteroidota bacterium]
MIRKTGYIITLLLLFGCRSDWVVLNNSDEKKNLTWEIKYHRDCCGCYAYYYNLYESGSLKHQFVTELGCSIYVPTLHVFEPGEEKEPTPVISYIAVDSGAYDLKISNLDKQMMHQLDSIYKPRSVNDRQIKFSHIIGFRIVKPDEQVHFPFLD